MCVSVTSYVTFHKVLTCKYTFSDKQFFYEVYQNCLKSFHFQLTADAGGEFFLIMAHHQQGFPG